MVFIKLHILVTKVYVYAIIKTIKKSVDKINNPYCVQNVILMIHKFLRISSRI